MVQCVFLEMSANGGSEDLRNRKKTVSEGCGKVSFGLCQLSPLKVLFLDAYVSHEWYMVP